MKSQFIELVYTDTPRQVIIVGAGPAGLIMALMLAQKGIHATIVEKADDIDHNPRASFYSSPTIHELRRAGLMEDIMQKAFVPDGVAWRVMGEPFQEVCTLAAENPPGKETMISLPLDELLPIMAAHLSKFPHGTVLFEHEVLEIGQNEGKAWVDVKTPEGEKRMEADYVVGCDGANSIIRRQLFGNEFPGFTWDKQIVATNAGVLTIIVNILTDYEQVYYPKFKSYGWTSSTFQMHPEHFPSKSHRSARSGLYNDCSNI